MSDAQRGRPGVDWRLGLTVALLVGAAYLPAMQGEFLMSDQRVVVENPRLVGAEGLREIWSPIPSPQLPPQDQYQPLSYTALWLERQLWGLEPRGYQIVSVLLHALNALLVWNLLARIGVRGAGVAALVFALHPVHVESVAWIYEQKNPLSGAFFLLSLLAYLRFDQGRQRRWYAACVALFAAALLSKASSVMLPALILLYAWFRRDPWTRTLARCAPLLAMAALMAGLTLWYEQSITGAEGAAYAAGALERLARPGWVALFHAGKLLFPARLAFFYPLWSIEASSWAAYLPDLALLALLGLLWLRRESWGRPALLGIGAYLVLLFPVLGLFDIYYHQFSLAADHFQYLPSIGLIALGVGAGIAGIERIGTPARSPARPRAALLMAATLLVGACWVLTWQRSAVFANDGRLARDAADKYPTSWLAFQKSGEFWLKRAFRAPGDPGPAARRAIADLERAVELRPEHPQVRDSLGVALLHEGRLDEARRQLELAVAGDPANPDFHRNLASVLEAQGETEWALAEWRAMLEAAPSSLTARVFLARALVQSRRFHEAVAVLEPVAPPPAGRSPRGRRARLLREALQLRVQAAAGATHMAAAPAPEDAPRWNVLLLTVDTLRPDYLSLNGYDRATSPALDALLGGGFYFEQALAPVPRTTPALASLLTGAYPHTTGVRELADRLPGGMLTLAEALGRHGYRSWAVVTNLMLGAKRGLGAGFDAYDFAPDVRGARRTTEAALQLIETADPEAPFFAWVHYIDPHVPYHPPEEIARRFDPGYAGRFRLSFGRQPGPGEPDSLFQEFPDGLRKSQVTHRNPLTDEENAHIRRLYAGEIRMLDSEIERLLRALRSRFPSTVIVFAADHGESLGEQDFYFDHGDYVNEASSRVPLAFVLPPEHPWHGSGRRSGWVSLVDVAPTLFDIVQLEPPPEMAVLFEGRSLAPALRGEPLPPIPVFMESGTSFFPELVRRRQRNSIAGRFRSVTLEDWKLIWTPFLPAAEAFQLYDLAADPGEARDLYRPDHPRVARLQAHLKEWLGRAAAHAAAPPPLDPADREALRSLGYLE